VPQRRFDRTCAKAGRVGKKVEIFGTNRLLWTNVHAYAQIDAGSCSPMLCKVVNTRTFLFPTRCRCFAALCERELQCTRGLFCRHNQVVRWVTRLTFARVLSASTWMLTLRRSEALYPLSDVHVTGGAQAPCSCDAGRSSPSASSVADCSGPQLRKDRGTSKGTPLQRRWCSLDRSFTRGVPSTTRRSRDQ
jgi:hypothetical protein